MRYLILFFLAIVLVSCSNPDETGPESSEQWEYMPLETGNYWKLGNFPKWSVTGMKTINGKEYYERVDINGTDYVRVEQNKVFYIPASTRDSAFEEAVMFDGNAKVNDKWNFFEWEVTLKSESESLVIGDTTINNCRKYYFNIPKMADEEYNLWLAPGIGYIQYQCLGECISTIMKLEEARIGGIIPAFLADK